MSTKKTKTNGALRAPARPVLPEEVVADSSVKKPLKKSSNGSAAARSALQEVEAIDTKALL